MKIDYKIIYNCIKGKASSLDHGCFTFVSYEIPAKYTRVRDNFEHAL